MPMLVTVLIVGVLWLCPIMIQVGTAGTTGEQPLEQRKPIAKDNFKLVQERLKTEAGYAGPIDGEFNTQTEAALRAYQEKHGLPVTGAADEATLRQLQLTLPTIPQGQ
jgi:peptidoglycan hydrolase-like protein with peptidoglycan-binding domain